MWKVNIDEKYQSIEKLWKDGKDPMEIASEIGCTKANVYQVLNKLGLRTPKKKNSISTCLPDLIKMRQEGKSLWYMSHKTGLHETSISKALSEIGLRSRPYEQNEDGQYDLAVPPVKHRPINIGTCIVDGKRYQDVTEMFLESRF